MRLRRPQLLEPDALSPARSSLRDRGHLGLRGLFPRSEIAQLRSQLEQLTAPVALMPSPGMDQDVGAYGAGWSFREQLWRRSPWLESWLLEGPPAIWIQRLLDRHDIWLLRDQAYFKHPGGEPTPWHQDGTFIPVDGLQSLTLWIPLTAVDAAASPMHYVDGSQRSCALQVGGGLSFETGLQEQASEASPQAVAVYDRLAPGDCLMHDTWTLHGSPSHRAPHPRLAYVVVYGYGDGSLADQHALNGCGPLLRDQAALLRRSNQRSCFPELTTGDPVPGLSTPYLRVV